MPTAYPRRPITETPEIAEAIDLADQRWPEEHGNRTRLLLRLIAVGKQAITTDQAERLAAIRKTSAALPGVFTPHGLAELREDWPE